MSTRQYVSLAFLLIFLILATACTDTSPDQSQQTPPPTATILPGQVLRLYGEVSGQGIPGGTIDTITFTVGLVNSYDSVDMEQLSIVYADAIRTETLRPVPGFYGDPPKGSWGILRVENEVGSPNNRLEYEERFVIRINPTAYLVPRQVITIDLKTPNSRSLTLRRVAPPSIQADNILSPL